MKYGTWCAALALAFLGCAGEARDPYLWLEEATGERALAWVRERNTESTGVLARGEAFAGLQERLLGILDSEAKIPFIRKQGPWFYNLWRDARNPRGLLRRTTLEEYRKPEPLWEGVLDLDALAKAEKENWVYRDAAYLEPACERCLLSLSRGGADAVVVREFDLKTKSFVADGFVLPEAKSHAAWIDRDTLFVATDFGPGSLTRSGYPRVVKAWKRGTPLSAAEAVLEGRPDDVSVSADHDPTRGFERDLVQRATSIFDTELFLRREGRLIRIEKPADAVAAVFRDLLFLELRTDWQVDGRTYPAGALIAADFEGFLKGARGFQVLFEPAERRSLAGYVPTRNHVVLNELDNVRNRLSVLTRRDGAWVRAPMPGAPDFCSLAVSAVDAGETDAYFLTQSGYLTPTSLHYGELGKGPPACLKQLPSFFDARGLSVAQHEAVSADGTRIPYFQVARGDMALDGGNPALLTGYGGFKALRLPFYGAEVGAAWLERGGVFVVANIRGGGEFGPAWHQAAVKANRPRAYEDFIAVAEDLVRRRVTSPAHLSTLGVSNGGLLVGNMLTMRPDLFGAVVCRAPLLDMRRYHRLLAGASWMEEYGNPDDPGDWAFLRTFSPYHNLRKEARYPPVLFTTSTRDDRVHPGHARKMAARMREMGQDALLYENVEGGHHGAADHRQQAFMAALAYTFLWGALE